MFNPAPTLLLAGALALAGAGAACAQSVALSGLLGAKALLVVDGGAPKSVGVGETHRGVKLVSTQADQAVVEIAGQRQTLRLGEGPLNAGGATGASSNGRIVLHAASNGHFLAQGQINGRAVALMVDTGASAVGISMADAERIGLNYQAGRPVHMNTANGVSTGWLVKLNSVRLGSVDVFNVDAVVTPAPMPYVLLGNSFLTRFQMTRTNDELVLEKRY
jgi:aspartyl protease family protein